MEGRERTHGDPAAPGGVRDHAQPSVALWQGRPARRSRHASPADRLCRQHRALHRPAPGLPRHGGRMVRSIPSRRHSCPARPCRPPTAPTLRGHGTLGSPSFAGPRWRVRRREASGEALGSVPAEDEGGGDRVSWVNAGGTERGSAFTGATRAGSTVCGVMRRIGGCQLRGPFGREDAASEGAIHRIGKLERAQARVVCGVSAPLQENGLMPRLDVVLRAADQGRRASRRGGAAQGTRRALALGSRNTPPQSHRQASPGGRAEH